jgi:hypothetical protein
MAWMKRNPQLNRWTNPSYPTVYITKSNIGSGKFSGGYMVHVYSANYLGKRKHGEHSYYGYATLRSAVAKVPTILKQAALADKRGY